MSFKVKLHTMIQFKALISGQFSAGALSGIDTLANCNKVQYDKICKYFGKLTQERKNFENLPTPVEVTC